MPKPIQWNTVSPALAWPASRRFWLSPVFFAVLGAALAAFILCLVWHKRKASQKQRREQAEKALLSLLSHALFERPLSLPENTDFEAVLGLAERHMVFGIVGEALGSLSEDALPRDLLLSLQEKTVSLLRQNARLAGCREHLCAFLKEQNIPAAILKGDSVAALYPTPELRVAGDIDCLLREKDLPEAINFLEAHGFAMVEKDGEHHVVLKKGSVMIELHRAVSGLPQGPVGVRIKELLADTLATAKAATIEGKSFPVPDSFHQGLILLLHMQQHMREGGLGLRQVCDWALFVAKDLTKEATPRLLEVLREVGLLRFAEAVTAGAVRHLGLPPERSPFTGGDIALADALFTDFLASGNFGNGNLDFVGSATVTLNREKGKGALATAISSVSGKCKREWPISAKHPSLLLFLVPFWVIRRVLRSPTRPLSMLRSAGKRGKLYDRLELFSTDKKTPFDE